MARSFVFAFLVLSACTHKTAPLPNSTVARHSASLAISPDGSHVYVANADADSVSVVNTATKQVETEILLNGVHPAMDSIGRFTPAIMPRALALSPAANRLYVSGERSTQLQVIDLKQNKVIGTVSTGSEPIGVLVSPDETSVYVACSNEEEVLRIDTATLKVVATAATWRKPWALAWSADSKTLYATHLLGSDDPATPGPAVSAIDPSSMKILDTWNIADRSPIGDGGQPTLSYGQARGVYDMVERPGADEFWIAHLSLANLTPQPTLAFNTTVFPTLSLFDSDGTFETYLSTDATSIPGINGAFGDVVSGPHSLAFTADGLFALVVDMNSEDVLVVDAVNRVEVPSALVRPLPGHMPDGIVMSPDGTHAYVDERNTGDLAILDVNESVSPITVTVEPGTIPLYTPDPMPAQMRLGQHLFFSANSDELPITQNHWVACGSCHVEGRSDAVTWRFASGPRDTPSNAGGTIDTGFLLHTADRSFVQDYWHTIATEQGGNLNPSGDVANQILLNALESYVDGAIPVPIPPHYNVDQVAVGKQAFVTAGCNVCHDGPALTDSGAGNPTLDLSGAILLHDVGTCNTGSFPDVRHPDDDGNMHQPCMFDTPALRGLNDSAPYFHDGSAATLEDVLEMTRGKMGNIGALDGEQETALVAYLRSL